MSRRKIAAQRFTIDKELDTMRKSAIEGIHGTSGRRRLRLLLATVMAVGLFATLASAAQAAAPALTLRTAFPDAVKPGEVIRAGVNIENSGNASITGAMTMTVTLPEGVSLEYVQGPEGPAEGPCEVVADVLTCNMNAALMYPNAQVASFVNVKVASDASGELGFKIEATSAGVADPVSQEKTVVVGPPKPFGIDFFDALVKERNGADELQAGAAPGTVTNIFEVPTFNYGLYGGGFFSINGVSAHMRNIVVHTPAGITANFDATPSRCTAAQLSTPSNIPGLENCPIDSQMGVAHVFGRIIVPVYNMVPPHGNPAAFGFSVLDVPIFIYARLRPSDFGVDLVSVNTSSTVPIDQVDVSFWGVPADASHDTGRGECLLGILGHNQAPESCPTGDPLKAFLRLPTSCSGPLPWSIDIDSYEEPNVYRTKQDTTPAQVGCNQLEFTPSLEAKPSTNVGDSPSGLELKLHLPQNDDPEGLAEAHLKDFTLRMPEGLTLNSAGADGLGACSPAEIGLITPVGQTPALFNAAEPQCPDASKLGLAVVDSPAIDHPLPATVYLASQGQNPFGSLIALYLAIVDPQSGVVVKIPMEVQLDPHTGQLTTVVRNNPQLPFEDLSIELDKGPHAPLRTPLPCGRFTSQSHWTPWSSPEGKDADASSSFQVIKAAGEGACVASEAQAPFNPSLEAGTLEPRAGTFSPFSLKVSRSDGSQGIGAIDLDLPKGLLASLGGIPYCSDAALAAVPTAPGTGQGEIAHPSCPPASQIGTVATAVGAGPSPFHVNTGHAYWTGPYRGAPVSMAVIVPAVAGPFDLGNVVVRTGFYVDPETAQITAKSDPLPSIIEGIPLDLRTIKIDLDRPNYTLNPTSCDPMAFQGRLQSTLGQLTSIAERFQVGGCATLPFKPKLSLSLKGETARRAHPALRATLRFPKGRGANIAKASVALPGSELLDQSHIGTICTRVQFAADQCPKGSIYGYARAYSPILDYSLAGPVYLRSSSHKLPDLVADLNGQIEIALVGRIDSDRHGGIRTTFESVPDAPVSKFTLEMFGGKKGLLQNSINLCRGEQRATVHFDAQNGKTADQRPPLKVRCSKGAPKAPKKRGHH